MIPRMARAMANARRVVTIMQGHDRAMADGAGDLPAVSPPPA